VYASAAGNKTLLALLLGVIVTPRMGVLGVIITPGLLLLLLLLLL
jgi:hypothetical protein